MSFVQWMGLGGILIAVVSLGMVERATEGLPAGTDLADLDAKEELRLLRGCGGPFCLAAAFFLCAEAFFFAATLLGTEGLETAWKAASSGSAALLAWALAARGSRLIIEEALARSQ